MSKKSMIGRPEVHGLEVITGDRLRRTRFALCNGSTRIEVAEKIFKISPKTLRRYTEKEDIRSKLLKRAIDDGEALRDEPLGRFICYLLDKKEETLSELSKYMYQLPDDENESDLDALEISEEDEAEYLRLRDLADDYSQRLEQAIADNAEVRGYQEVALKVKRGKKRIEGLEEVQQNLFNNHESLVSRLRGSPA